MKPEGDILCKDHIEKQLVCPGSKSSSTPNIRATVARLATAFRAFSFHLISQ
jgi:hypothetical protein